MPAQLYTGLEQPVVASITTGEHTVRCYVFVDRRRGALVSASFKVHENGAETDLFYKTIREVEAEEPYGPDCPKIIAVGTVFVVHWLEGEVVADEPSNPTLHKAWLDVANYDDVPDWTYAGSLPVFRFMHDLAPSGDPSSGDYFVAYTTDELGATVPVVQRQNGLTWLDVDWIEQMTHAVQTSVLSLYASIDEGVVLLCYERVGGSANEVWCTRLDADDGLSAAHSQVFTSLPAVHLLQAGFARYSASSVSLLIDFTETFGVAGSPTAAGLAIPSLAGGNVSIATAAMGSHHAWHHLRMLSQPWSFAGSRESAAEPNVYVLAAYKNALAENEFIQRNAFVLNMDAQRWAGAENHTVRPRPVSNLTLGDFDARVSGSTPDGAIVAGFSIGRRVNQLSAASPGAERGLSLKTRTVAAVCFAKLMSISSVGQPQLQPVGGTVKGVRFHPEEPWMLARDPSEPEAPAVPYHGLSPFTVGQAFEAGAGGFVGGGTPAYFHGRGLDEAGYCWFPEIYDISEPQEGNVDPGTYLYCATYEQRDTKGQLHRSAPSLPVSREVEGSGLGSGPSLIALEISTLTLTMRDNLDRHPGAPPVEVVVWRTTAGGTVFRRVYAQYGAANRPQDTPVNDASTWFVTAYDNVPDEDLVRQEILPFQLISGAWTPLPPFQPPAFRCVAKWQNRVWGVSSQDGQIWYSHEILPEQGGTAMLAPEFNPALVHRVDGLGRIVAMQEMDDALVLFTEDAIYALTGFGADPSGAGSSLQVRTVVTGVGCIEPRSVVLTPDGIFFQSYKGLYLLNRGQALEFLTRGAAVEDSVLAGGNVRAATHMKDRAEIRFALNDEVTGAPSVLLYDYQHDLWSHFSLPLGDQPGGSAAMSAVVGGCEWRGTGRESLHVVIEQGAVLVERSANDAAPYTDQDRNSDDAIPLEVATAWVHPSVLAGYQRTQEIGISLDKPSASGVAVDVSTDMDGSYDPDALVETFPFPSPAPAYLSCRLRYQKGAAYRVRVYELGTIPEAENLSITGMTMKVGLKRGLRRR
jgi:hypothetical protein